MLLSKTPYESYKYIYNPPGEITSECLETRYKTIDDIGSRFIVYAAGKGYRVYENHTAFLNHLHSLPDSERVFHEVILGRKPQKLKFDIDAKAEQLNGFEIPQDDDIMTLPATETISQTDSAAIDNDILALLDDFCADHELPGPVRPTGNTEKYYHIRETIRTAIRDTFFTTYGADIPTGDEIICESTCLEGKKYSTHIIIDNIYVSSNIQAQEFTQRVRAILPNSYRQFVDMTVNKSLQNFRVVNCHKQGDVRVKKILTEHRPEATIITNVIGCKKLNDIVETNAARKEIHIPSEEVETILEMARKDSSVLSHRFRAARGDKLIFTRLEPSYCEFCDETHHTDNTLFLRVKTLHGVTSIYKYCRHYLRNRGCDGTHSAKIGEFASNVASDDSSIASNEIDSTSAQSTWIDNVINRCLARIGGPETTLFDRLPPGCANVYSDPELAPFELTNTLVVHAAMKMGKTKALSTFINKYFESKISPKIVRFISFRQTFSGNIKEKFPDFTLYSDVRGPLTDDRLIVQVESLHRLLIREGADSPDLLILDECESIFEQFDSGLLKTNFGECFAKFQYLIKYSKHVICMDANISDRTYRILQQMRPAFAAAIGTGRTMVYHHNTYKNAQADKYYVCGDKLKWLGLLYTSLNADEKIAVPMSSLTEAKVLVANLKKQFPEKNIKLYSSETSQSEKREHFSNVNAYWVNYDVLVYTPTISAGVSFEQKHFTKIFGYFTDQSCPVETCQQMIGRIRDVADHEFYICINASGNNLPTGIEELKSFLYNRRDNLSKMFDMTGLHCEYGPDGELTYHTGDYFQLWLENSRIRNLSKNSFIKRFINITANTGASIMNISNEMFEQLTGLPPVIDGEINDELSDIKQAHTLARVEIKETECKCIAASAELTDAEADEILSLRVAQKDITNEQKFAFEKYRLRADYKYDGPIDDKFVSKYHDVKVRRIYKNMTRIANRTIQEAWTQIQAEELANHKHLMSMGERGQNQDIGRRYVFDQHRYALGLLNMCGWNGIHDPQYIHKVALFQKITAAEKKYWENIRPACVEFGIRTPLLRTAQLAKGNPEQYISIMLKPVNKILQAMYGIAIITKKNDPGMYFLNMNTLFTMDPDVSRGKHIPLIIPPDRPPANQGEFV